MYKINCILLINMRTDFILTNLLYKQNKTQIFFLKQYAYLNTHLNKTLIKYLCY